MTILNENPSWKNFELHFSSHAPNFKKPQLFSEWIFFFQIFFVAKVHVHSCFKNYQTGSRAPLEFSKLAKDKKTDFF